jgi:hypothetical protein
MCERIAMNEGRSRSSRAARERRLDRVEILDVVDALHVPALSCEPRDLVLGRERDRGRAVDRDAVVVPAPDQLPESVLPRDRRRLV